MADKVAAHHFSLADWVPAPVFRAQAFKKISRAISRSNGVVYKLADSFEERVQAIDLVYKRYLKRGILDIETAELPFFLYNLLPGTTTFVALKHDRVVGTISLIEDSILGVPMEEVHPREILAQRLNKRRFAEVGTLAVSEKEQGAGVSLMLYNALFRWARNGRFLDDLVIAVHPRMARFYRTLLLFQKTGPCQTYKKYGGALSVPLGLDVPGSLLRFRQLYDRSRFLTGEHGSFYSFFCEQHFPHMQIPESGRMQPRFQEIPQWHEADIPQTLLRYGVSYEQLPDRYRRSIEKLYAHQKAA
jgi:GNAT superfamily N-acetyltransferase